jgi:hypothetical protein
LGGVRKLRIAVAGRGKRGGARTIYFYAARDGQIFFLLTYAKNEQPDLTPDQRAVVRALAETLRKGGG